MTRLGAIVRGYQARELQELFDSIDPEEMRRFIEVMTIRQEPIENGPDAFVIRCTDYNSYVPELFDLYETYETIKTRFTRYKKLQKYE